MRVKVKRAGHEVARSHDRWHIDCVIAMTRPAGTRESMPGPTSDSLGSAWRRAEQRQELRDGWVFGVERSSVWSRYLYPTPSWRKLRLSLPEKAFYRDSEPDGRGRSLD